MPMPESITIEVDGNRKTVARADYVRLKLKDLQAFGYTTLTAKTLDNQIDLVMAGGELTAIGVMIENEIVDRPGVALPCVYRGYEIRRPKSSGGKAGKGKNASSSLQICEDSGTSYRIVQTVRVKNRDKKTEASAFVKCKRLIDEMADAVEMKAKVATK